MSVGRRAPIRAAHALIVILVVGLLLAVFGLLNRPRPVRVYTVAQVATIMAYHPQAWLGRIIDVRGIAHGLRRHRRCAPGAVCRPLFYLFDPAATSAIPVVIDPPPSSLLDSLRRLPLIGAVVPAAQPVTPSFFQTATYRVQLQATSCQTEPCVVADLTAGG